jgi:putative toxin-antitoxin system antitoxin component (TIGR02293 family)
MEATRLTAEEPRLPWPNAPGADQSLVLDFWAPPQRRRSAAQAVGRHTFQALVLRVAAAPGAGLFDALEHGVPTRMVGVIAETLGEPASAVMALLGVSLTTLRRKEEAGEPLPDVAGHRVMALLRLVATLRRLLAESGDAQALAQFDLEAWVARWLRLPLPQMGGKTPAQLLRNPEGQRALEQVLERMRGGLPA